jgi:acyl-CoA thioesterase-1
MFRTLLIASLALTIAPVQASTLLVLGDSISAGYGLANVAEGWVALLNGPLAQSGYQVVNAGISGDTTAGGLNRLPRLIEKHSPDIVIIELGGNDGLRGISIAEMDRNLREIVMVSRKAGAVPVLLGMQMPPNFGKQFAERFETTYSRIARDLSVVFVAGFLKGVGDVPELMQPDAIHPNATAQALLEKKVLDAVTPLLKLKHPVSSQKKEKP